MRRDFLGGLPLPNCPFADSTIPPPPPPSPNPHPNPNPNPSPIPPKTPPSDDDGGEGGPENDTLSFHPVPVSRATTINYFENNNNPQTPTLSFSFSSGINSKRHTGSVNNNQAKPIDNTDTTQLRLVLHNPTISFSFALFGLVCFGLAVSTLFRHNEVRVFNKRITERSVRNSIWAVFFLVLGLSYVINHAFSFLYFLNFVSFAPIPLVTIISFYNSLKYRYSIEFVRYAFDLPFVSSVPLPQPGDNNITSPIINTYTSQEHVHYQNYIPHNATGNNGTTLTVPPEVIDNWLLFSAAFLRSLSTFFLSLALYSQLSHKTPGSQLSFKIFINAFFNHYDT
jgi:hypothetical protein